MYLPLELPPLSLYVHLPWCVRKCPYCDFNSHPSGGGPVPEDRYVDALLDDLAQEVADAAGRELISVFIGGGTPSLFRPESVARLLGGIAARIPLAPNAEITLEANPGAAERERFAGYREAGVNRLSVGVQSFDDDLLRSIGRIHDGRQARLALEVGATAGFSRINVDLMYGLPGQTPAQALADIRLACRLAAGHISHYQLTLEPGTPFHHRPPALPDSDNTWRMQRECGQALAGAGFLHYETSAWARPGEECRHNLNYWRFGDYLGIGAGAHAKLTTPGRNAVVRRWKQRGPKAYMGAAAGSARIGGEIPVAPADRALEYLMNALRLAGGADLSALERRTGVAAASLSRPIGTAVHRGLAIREDNLLRPTERGRRFLDDLLLLFLPETADA
ncbi:MAG TPA: radical SAM family heme chaperone HemW [Gammaproteobacteria bacterium]|nr:radical SAM family heme chaperone HemW [Gammaproteobacteria bacterium]